MRQQREVLKHHSHLVAANVYHLLRRRLEQIGAVKHDPPVGRLNQARQTAHQGRLARAAQPHHHQYLAFMHIEGGAAHRRDVAALGERRIARIVLVAAKKLARVLAVEFPDVVAGYFDRWLIHSGIMTAARRSGQTHINDLSNDFRAKLRGALQQHLPQRQRKPARDKQLIATPRMPQGDADMVERV